MSWLESLRRERSRLMATMTSLTDDEFDNGTTLCADWAPRDVLAHVIGNDRTFSYVRYGSIDRANAAMVHAGRSVSREELLRQGSAIAINPSPAGRAFAWLLAGDCAMHHQDVLRGLGLPHDLPPESERAILREGTIWSWVFGAKLLHHRVQPTTPGSRARGRGKPVRGTTEALSLWLAGRNGIESELDFG
jgi:uncharacterized protein (TIGR03083 family)